MKTYFRLLSFAKPIEKFALPFIPLTVLAIIFNTLNLALLAPLLETLFSGKRYLATDPASEPSFWNILGTFNYYVDYSIVRFGEFDTLKYVCTAIVVSVFLANVFKYFSQRIIENLRIHTLLNIRKIIFSNVMDLHIGFFNNERKGDIISKIASDVQVVQYSVTNTLQVVFREPLQLIAYVIMLFLISPTLTFYSLLVIPVTALIIARIVSKLKKQATASHESFSTMISTLDESLSGIKIIKAFNATSIIKNKFDTENQKYSKISRSMSARQQLASPVSEFMGVTMVACIVLYGGYLIFISRTSFLKPSDFITYIAIFSQVLRPAKALTDSFSNIHSGIAAGERVLDLIDEKPAIVNRPGAAVISGFNDRIIFDNVSFSYGEKIILKNINLEIPRGKTVALVGPSGGGKSTLMDLVPRFIEPKSGRVIFDEKDIRDVTMESLRGQMGFVNQESILFNDSIFNNIAFGKPQATMAEVESAARIANAHEFIIKTTNGYQTTVGDRGVRLSGGQKQRISIARAVLSNPPIMLLDEATSALDTESEKLVQDALNKLMLNRTSVVIAHRLSTIQNADIIVVIDAGGVVEKGSHRELMSANGLYKRLIEMQTFSE